MSDMCLRAVWLPLRGVPLMWELWDRREGHPRGAEAARPSPAHRLCPLQELEQQLMMEQRTYRKTLKFYQKLLQKEKRSKGRAL